MGMGGYPYWRDEVHLAGGGALAGAERIGAAEQPWGRIVCHVF